MIPKVIHYIWLGAKMPALQRACIESWKIYCPDYELILWNENNIPKSSFVEKLIRKKYYAFASDYLRLQILHENGGIYLDCDIELIRPLDSILLHDSFVVEESPGRVNNAVTGGRANAKIFQTSMDIMLDSFERKNLILYSPEVTTLAIKKLNQEVSILPSAFFYPYNPYAREIKNLLYSDISPETIGIHHWSKSWSIPLHKKIKRKIYSFVTGNK